jgi:hypothetical protein
MLEADQGSQLLLQMYSSTNIDPRVKAICADILSLLRYTYSHLLVLWKKIRTFSLATILKLKLFFFLISMLLVSLFNFINNFFNNLSN